MTNCLWERVALDLKDDGEAVDRFLYNNLLRGGTLTLFRDGAGVSQVRDTLFDQTTITQTGTITHDHNAYLSGGNRLTPTNANDKVLTNAAAYQAGALGKYYYPTNDGMLSLLGNAGSRNAYAAGLYHYTTTTNQVKETNSVVEIGFHYVTVSNGVAADLDGDGLPDYADTDADGDGMLDSWEVQNGLNPLINDAGDDPDGDWFTNLQEYGGGTNSTNPQDVMVVAWGKNTAGECNVPLYLRDVVAVAAGYDFSLALRKNGSVVAWGNNASGQTSVPALLTNAITLSASWQQAGAVKTDGRVEAWGLTTGSVPGVLTNAVGVAVGEHHGLGVGSNGMVVAWGGSPYGEADVPPSVTNVLQVTAGWSHSVALLSDRTARAWGANFSVWSWSVTNPPTGLSNVQSIAAGGYHTLALKLDGTVVAWGAGNQTNGTAFADQGQSIVPAGLTGVVAIAAGGYRSLALRADSTLAAWGYNFFGQSSIPAGLTNIIGMAAGADHTLALRKGRQLPVVLLAPVSRAELPGTNATFSAFGLGLAEVKYQWQFNGTNIAGQTNANLTVNNIATNNEGGYTVVMSTGAGSITSSVATLMLIGPPVITNTVPPEPSTNWLTSGSNAFFTMTVNATALAADRYPIRYQWFTNGIAISNSTNANLNILQSSLPWVRGWVTNPANAEYSVKVWNPVGTNQAGAWSVRVISPSKDGSTVVWGNNADHQAEYPIDLTNTLAIAAGRAHAASLQEDGRVRVWGDNTYGQTNVPANLSNVIAIAAGDDHNLALKADGSVAAWGRNNFNQTSVPTNLTNAIAVSAGGVQSLALRKDSTVIQWGQTNAAIPNGLTNVIAIASGTNFHLALRSNTTVVAWGQNNYGQTNVPAGLSNVVAIAAGGFHAIALTQDGSVTNWGLNTSGQCNVPVGLSNVMAVAAGWTHSVALKNDGTVVVWGDNTYGQTNAVPGLGPVKSIAAGGHSLMAAIFSPLVQYPVDVTKDLLLIFNTTSTNSIVVKDYYLAQRPMVGGANTLGFSCAANEVISTADFTNQILASYRTWLTNNPTKRPQFLILFPDLPTRIWGDTNDPFTYSNSVAFDLHSGASGIPPFVTSINMGLDYLGASYLTNDCIAYINKLRDFGTNYSPGKLFISVSKSAYGNTNFVLDNLRHGPGFPFPEFDRSGDGGIIASVTNTILNSGTAGLHVTYNNQIETNNQPTPPHITNAVNVAGYMCWGSHSSLGNEYSRRANVISWTGNSSWWVIETLESYNGIRHPGQGNFTQWFSQNAFGGINYANTPVGAVTHTDEPNLSGINNADLYFGLWAMNKAFAICAWNSRNTPRFQAVGDPFVQR